METMKKEQQEVREALQEHLMDKGMNQEQAKFVTHCYFDVPLAIHYKIGGRISGEIASFLYSREKGKTIVEQSFPDLLETYPSYYSPSDEEKDAIISEIVNISEVAHLTFFYAEPVH